MTTAGESLTLVRSSATESSPASHTMGFFDVAEPKPELDPKPYQPHSNRPPRGSELFGFLFCTAGVLYFLGALAAFGMVPSDNVFMVVGVLCLIYGRLGRILEEIETRSQQLKSEPPLRVPPVLKR